jgi:hypothetical protein
MKHVISMNGRTPEPLVPGVEKTFNTKDPEIILDQLIADIYERLQNDPIKARRYVKALMAIPAPNWSVQGSSRKI